MRIARSINNNLLTLLITFSLLSACAYQNHEASEFASGDAEPATSVVLVHGANLRASSFVEVEKLLSNKGLKVTSPQIYTPEEETDLGTVAGRLCRDLEDIKEKSVLVGHSQGGAIITEASTQCPDQIRKLIFIAAVIPLPGEGAFDKLSPEDIKNFERCAELKDDSYFVPTSPRGCHANFMNNISDKQKALYFFERDFVKEHVGIGNSKANYDPEIFSSIPKSYIVTKDDKIISQATQSTYIKIHQITDISSLESDHTPFYSQPKALSKTILSLLN